MPLNPIFLGRVPLITKIDYRKNIGYQLILASLLEDLLEEPHLIPPFAGGSKEKRKERRSHLGPPARKGPIFLLKGRSLIS